MTPILTSAHSRVKPFITTEAEQARPLNVLGERITVLAAADQTGGLELFRVQGVVDQGPPPHAHDWDETFYVTAGEVEIGADGASRRVGPGGFAYVPAGVTHWFRFVTAGEMISVTSGAGASKLFAAFDSDIPPGPPDPMVVAAVAQRNGARLV